MHITLTVIEGPQKGKTFPFNEPDNFLLGDSKRYKEEAGGGVSKGVGVTDDPCYAKYK
jgi:hypothetical protein